jgi:hypothetical protein
LGLYGKYGFQNPRLLLNTTCIRFASHVLFSRTTVSCTQPIQSNISMSAPANPAATEAVNAKCSLGGKCSNRSSVRCLLSVQSRSLAHVMTTANMRAGRGQLPTPCMTSKQFYTEDFCSKMFRRKTYSFIYPIPKTK